ncbi:diversity-generating retroelement protein Avd [Plectonema radiosum]|uniref:diversity-generating retroelement protein Avd n=1 Tax=Plectonema radiosum TaxID=945768 RepID=UPI001D145283|nr:diversity-generating retroelement protein Avd [Plectonema radiosum]
MPQLQEELPIIQKTYDLIKWYVPILNRLPKVHKFTLADRTVNKLYDLLENLIVARYAQEKLTQLQSINAKLVCSFRAWGYLAITPRDIYFSHLVERVEKGWATPSAARWFVEQQS